MFFMSNFFNQKMTFWNSKSIRTTFCCHCGPHVPILPSFVSINCPDVYKITNFLCYLINIHNICAIWSVLVDAVTWFCKSSKPWLLKLLTFWSEKIFWTWSIQRGHGGNLNWSWFSYGVIIVVQYFWNLYHTKLFEIKTIWIYCAAICINILKCKYGVSWLIGSNSFMIRASLRY